MEPIYVNVIRYLRTLEETRIMRIAVLSDLHLGAGDKADRTRGHDEHLLAVLSVLEAEHDQIILLGDVWETLTCRFPGTTRVH